MSSVKYDPKMDGVTHINIYSKGKTQLGRVASNFAYFPFEIPNDGRFSSVEGYWHWLGLEENLKEKKFCVTCTAMKPRKSGLNSKNSSKRGLNHILKRKY